MNITPKNTFQEIENAMASLSYPNRPVRPVMRNVAHKMTSEQLREHACAVEVYEALEGQYHTARAEYRKQLKYLTECWKEKLAYESVLNDKTFNIVYKMAWDAGHSTGWNTVRDYFNEYEEIARDIINANK